MNPRGSKMGSPHTQVDCIGRLWGTLKFVEVFKVGGEKTLAKRMVWKKAPPPNSIVRTERAQWGIEISGGGIEWSRLFG